MKDWKEHKVSLGVLAAAATGLISLYASVGFPLATKAEAAEDRRDTAAWRYEQTLLRLRTAREAETQLELREDLNPSTKAKLLANTRADIGLLERRLDCYNDIMETGQRKRCP